MMWTNNHCAVFSLTLTSTVTNLTLCSIKESIQFFCLQKKNFQLFASALLIYFRCSPFFLNG